jgi:hypothetical protein
MRKTSEKSLIHVKALGLHWQGRRLLCFEARDPEGRLLGGRPLGGTVEFDETARDAVIRELKDNRATRSPSSLI